jgi:IS30 family transposase
LSEPALEAEPTAFLLAQIIEPLPKRLRRSLTFDNGTEFAEHHRLRIKTFFCDPHAPWQKGGVENAVGRIRRWLPRQTNLEDLDPNDVLNAAVAYNHTPRRCLDFQTPAEVFSKLLHFKMGIHLPAFAGMTTLAARASLNAA